MKLDSVGDVFLTRKLYLTGDEEKEIIIKLGKPKNFPDSPDYYCPYQIVGIGKEKVGYVGGIDEIQALLLSMERVGAILYTSEEYRNGRLRWEGDESGDLGIPVPKNLRDLLPHRGEE